MLDKAFGKGSDLLTAYAAVNAGYYTSVVVLIF